MSKSKDNRSVYGRLLAVFTATFVVVIIGTIGVTFCAQHHSPQGNLSSQQQDCARSAPPNCVLGTVERASRTDFRGYIYCACVTANGTAKGFMAANSTVYPVDDTEARAKRTEPLGNDNPALAFPVGAPHR